MKKLLLYSLCFIAAFSGYSQVTQQFNGNVYFNRGLVPTADTLNTKAVNSLGLVGGRLYMRDPVKWIPIATDSLKYFYSKTQIDSLFSVGGGVGGISIKPDSVTLAAGPGVDTLKNWYNGLFVVRGYVDKQGGLISGGAVSYSGNGLVFNVSPATYYVNWVRTNSAAGQVTLPGADLHFNTIDAIGLDKSGNIIVVPGVPAINPLTPQVDPTKGIYLTSVLVRAGDTVPSGVKLIKVYDENAPPEWTVSSSGLSFDANNTLAPQHLLRAISTNSWTNGSKIIFSGSSTASIADYNLFQFYLNQKVIASAGSSITVTFLNNTTPVSTPVQVQFDKSLVGSYQAITLPLSNVSFSGINFNSIAITFNGTNTSGVYVDNVQLQGGVVVNLSTTGVTTFNLRSGNVIPIPNDYKVSDITGLLDSLAAKQPLLPTGDSMQYVGGDGLLHRILIPERDSVSFTNNFRNLGPKGYPIIDLKPTGTSVGTFTNATVSVDSMGRVTGIVSGTGGSGGGVSQVNSDWNATSGFAQILNKPTIPAPIDTSLMHNEIVQNTTAITNINNQIGATNLPNAILNGGYISWSGTGLTYNVTPAVYRINNKIYTSASSTFTLATADNLYNRIDQVIVDTLGAVSIITGTASANPATPQVNPASQLSLTTITVTAGSTTPTNIYTTTIYDEHTEWTPTNFGIAPNYENTVYPAHLFRATSIPSWANGSAILYSNGTGGGSTISINNYSALTMYVRLDAPVAPSANISVAFLNDQSQMCGAVTLTNSLGFDKNIVGIYQPVTIPISSFYFNNGYLINTLKFFLSGANATGLQIDFIQLQAGATQGTSNFLTDVSLHGVDSVGQTKNGIWNYRFKLPSGGGTGTVTSVNSISPVSGNVTLPIPAQFNPIAGTGISLSGTYPNVTFNSTATGGITGGTITGPGLLYTTPTTGVVTGSSINFTPALINQSAYTVLGNNTGSSATPTFSQVHVRAINATGSTYDGTKYLADDGTWKTIATGGGGSGGGLTDSTYFWKRNGNVVNYGDFLGSTNNQSFRIRTNNIERFTIDSLTGGMFTGYPAANGSMVFLPYGSLLGMPSLTGTNNILMGGYTSYNAANSNSVSIGQATVTGSGTNLAIGYGASASGSGIAIARGGAGAFSTGGIAIGNNSYSGSSGFSAGTYADARSQDAVAIGITATSSGGNTTAVGPVSNATASSSTAIGYKTYAAHSNSVAIGSNSRTSAANQFVAGGYAGGGITTITDVYFGSGPARDQNINNAAGGTDYTIHGSGAYGSDFAGGNIAIAGGQGTGTGTGGAIIFQTAGTSTTGATQNTLTEKLRVTPTGGWQFSTSTTPATPAAGKLVMWFDGTNLKAMKSDGSSTIIF